jgi:uncharacterized protein (TIGR02147 family)
MPSSSSRTIAATPVAKKPSSSGPKEDAPVPEPRLTNYTDYRQYLKDYYRFRKAGQARFSLRIFARKANFSSHTHLQYVMEGKRNLGPKTLVRLILAMELSSSQARFFQNLVFFNQAKRPDEKAFHYARLREENPGPAFKKMEQAQHKIFEEWYHGAILELSSVKGFRGHPGWIATRLFPTITPLQAQESLNLLVEAGFLRRVADSFIPVDPAVTTGDEVSPQLVRGYHLEMMRLAARAIDESPPEERDISAVCFTVKTADFPKVKRQIQQMRKQLKNFGAGYGDGNRVIQINIQLFPLSRI